MVIIREVMEKDIRQLEELFLITRQSAFKWESPDKFKISDYQESVEGEEVWVAEVDGEIVGFVSIWIQDSFIHNLFVHPDWQNKGIGRQLLNKAETRSELPMRLKVLISNIQACRFYQKQGWEKISTHEDISEPYYLFSKEG